MSHSQFTYTLQPGESITLFTDGISEAMNRDRDLWGIERLRIAMSPPAVGLLGEAVLGDVRMSVGATPQADDMCVVSFGREKQAARSADIKSPTSSRRNAAGATSLDVPDPATPRRRGPAGRGVP